MQRASYLLLAVTMVLVVVAATRGQTQQDGELRKLLTERRDTIKELVEAVRHNVRIGASTPDLLVQASVRLEEAELELAETRDARLKIHRKIVEYHRRLEEVTLRRHGQGLAKMEETLEAKVARLDSVIRLHRYQHASP